MINSKQAIIEGLRVVAHEQDRLSELNGTILQDGTMYEMFEKARDSYIRIVSDKE